MMKMRLLAQVTALSVLSCAFYGAEAATSLSAEQAAAKLSAPGRAKVHKDFLTRLFAAEQPELLVQFREDAADSSTISSTASKEARLADKKDRFAALRSRVFSRFASGDLDIKTAYSHLPMAHVKVKNRAALLAMIESGEVAAVFENTLHYANLAQSLPQIGQPAVVSQGHTGAGTTVAVLDTGLNYTHAAFGSCTAPGVPSTCRVPFVADLAPNDNALDADGHGTNVAGIVAGVAPGARIIGLDIFEGASASSAKIVEGVNWVIANSAQYNIVALNLSLGDSSQNPTECSSNYAQAAFAQARSIGIVPVVAAGNNAFTNGVSSPACAPSAVAVGAVYDANMGTLGFYTNAAHTTSCTDTTTALDKITCFSNSGAPLDLLAPGSAITAAGLTYNGTSQAAPHVAGAVAVLRASDVGQNVSADQTVQFLTSTGVNITDTRNNQIRPRLNLAAAVNAATKAHFSNSQLLLTGFSINAEKAFAADVNGDGKADLITFTGGDTADVYVAFSTGTGFAAPQKVHDWFAPAGEKPFVADVNGDGKADLITFTGGPQGYVWVSLSQGTTFAPSQMLLSGFSVNAEVPFVADINGDGKADLINFTMGSTAKVYVSFSTGTGFGTPQKLHDWFAPAGEKPFVADVNGDGKADLITFVGDAGGTVYVAYSTGTGFATSQIITTGFSPGAEQPFVADLNGDRKADFINFTKGNAADVWIALSKGTSLSPSVKVSDWFAPQNEKPFVADVNGDGRADLITFTGGAGGHVYVAFSLIQ